MRNKEDNFRNGAREITNNHINQEKKTEALHQKPRDYAAPAKRKTKQ